MTPTPQQIFDLVDQSWPPERLTHHGPWVIRQDTSGSKRTMAASLATAQDEARALDDLVAAEDQMQTLGQPLLFQIRLPDGALDAGLAGQGYGVIDRCTIYAGRVADLTHPLAHARAMPVWPPLQIQKEIWADGGIHAARRRIMARASRPKTSIIGRMDDRAAGAAFLSAHGRLAMVHALETLSQHRRKGVGRLMMTAAANWSAKQGIEWLSVIVLNNNLPARALYASLGMQAVGHYHYRIKDTSQWTNLSPR